MPTHRERRSPPQMADDELPPNVRQPRWLLPAAVAVAATGVLIGVLLATGFVTGGKDIDGQPAAAAGSLSDVERSASASPPPPKQPPAPHLPPPPSPAVETTDEQEPAQEPTQEPEESPEPALPPISAGPDELPPGVWLLRSAASSLCLDVASDGEVSGSTVQQAECTMVESQQWRASRTLLNSVVLVNVASGKCLDVAQLSQSNNATVQQYNCNSGLNQRWRVTSADDGTMTLKAVHSGKCLGVPDNSTSGTKVRQSPCDRSPRQQWQVR